MWEIVRTLKTSDWLTNEDWFGWEEWLVIYNWMAFATTFAQYLWSSVIVFGVGQHQKRTMGEAVVAQPFSV